MPSGHFVRSEAHKKAISEALKGKKKSPEHVAKLAVAFRGRVVSEETREKKRQWMLANNPRRGIKASDETKRKASKSHTGKSSLLKVYGVSREEYAKHREAGERWCWFGKHFVQSDQFKNRMGCCEPCKPLAYRSHDLKRKYNLTHDQYLEKLAAQGGGCAVCGLERIHDGDKHMMIDHNHETGAVRGILCGPCNTAMERLDSIPNWTDKALAYWKQFHVEQ